jgi:hypothetical protein
MILIEPSLATDLVSPASVEIRHEYIEFPAHVFNLSIAMIEGENLDQRAGGQAGRQSGTGSVGLSDPDSCPTRTGFYRS